MAQTEEQSPPRTIRVDGAGSPTLSFELPQGAALDVESVYAEISTGGAGDTIATVSVLDPSGVVIASKAQTRPIPAGGTGSATWALRLDDEPAAAPTATSIGAQIIRDAGAPGATVASGNLVVTTTFMRHNTVAYAQGITADVVANPSRLVIVTAGMYLVTVNAGWGELGAADYGYGVGFGGVFSPVQNPLQISRRIPSQVMVQEGTIIVPLNAGDAITQALGQNSGVAKAMPIGGLTAYRLGPII